MVRYTYGDKAQMLVHLVGAGPHRQVSIYAYEFPGNVRLAATVTTDANGYVTVPVKVARTGALAASFAGDATFDASTSPFKYIKVRAKVTTQMKRYLRRSGRYFVYKVGQTALQVGQVGPNHRGDCLGFHAQFWDVDRWGFDSFLNCVRLSSTSRAYVVLSGNGLAGRPIRLRAEWRGDRENLRNNSEWQYVKFVR